MNAAAPGPVREVRPLLVAAATTLALLSQVHEQVEDADPGLGIALTAETRILRFRQPDTDHSGGQLLFGPDGYLHIASGDGGGSGDQHGLCGNGQSSGVLLGKMLRIDVLNRPETVVPECGGARSLYRVPSTNPFVGSTGCDEIWTRNDGAVFTYTVKGNKRD